MFRKFLGALTSTAVVAGTTTAGLVGAGVVSTATPAVAATVNIGAVDAQMAGHTGQTNGNANGNCIRFNPPLNLDPPL